MAHKRKDRLQARRSLVVGLVRRILLRVVSGDLNAEEGCSQVRQIYSDESALLENLKPVVEAMGRGAKDEMIAAATDWLNRHPERG